MLTLLVLQGPDKGRRYELPDAPALLGRDSPSLPLEDNTVSRRHAELVPQNGDWVIHDLGSSNGTYVNGTRVEREQTLKLGDQIRVGRSLMLFGAQPGVSRAAGDNVQLAGEESGMDSSIMHTVKSNEDSMVLAVPEPAAAAMTNLRVLYQLGTTLGTSFDTNQVLEIVMDLIFEHVQADRGIIMLVDEAKNTLIPQVVRTRDETRTSKVRSPGDSGEAMDRNNLKIQASRTIINHVLNSGEGVLSSNAMADQRFSKGKSVHDMGIRSALCVPIKGSKLDSSQSEQIIGVIYIDSSVKNYTYSPDQLRLLTAIGLQAGMALQNAKLYQQGLQAERLAAIGETTAALSHSIKNILQALRGGADVVELGFKSSNIHQATKGWRIVDRNLDKIYNLTMNLLAFSKPREPKQEMVNPKSIIDDCTELVASAANEKGVMVISDVDKDHPPIPVDPDGIHQVIMNLLSNALDAVEPGQGLIRTQCKYDARKSQSIIEVIDNGSGIPPTMTAHLFELFHSTKGNRGTGLGLAVARKIVQEHEGEISVKSMPGQGSTFTIKLPVYEVRAGDPSHTHGPAN